MKQLIPRPLPGDPLQQTGDKKCQTHDIPMKLTRHSSDNSPLKPDNRPGNFMLKCRQMSCFVVTSPRTIAKPPSPPLGETPVPSPSTGEEPVLSIAEGLGPALGAAKGMGVKTHFPTPSQGLFILASRLRSPFVVSQPVLSLSQGSEAAGNHERAVRCPAQDRREKRQDGENAKALLPKTPSLPPPVGADPVIAPRLAREKIA